MKIQMQRSCTPYKLRSNLQQIPPSTDFHPHLIGCGILLCSEGGFEKLNPTCRWHVGLQCAHWGNLTQPPAAAPNPSFDRGSALLPLIENLPEGKKASPWGKVPRRGDRGYPGRLYCPGCVLGGAVPSFVCSFVAATFPQGEGYAPPEAIRQIPIYQTGSDTEQGTADDCPAVHILTEGPCLRPACP